jgi:hypothetical protein
MQDRAISLYAVCLLLRCMACLDDALRRDRFNLHGRLSTSGGAVGIALISAASQPSALVRVSASVRHRELPFTAPFARSLAGMRSAVQCSVVQCSAVQAAFGERYTTFGAYAVTTKGLTSSTPAVSMTTTKPEQRIESAMYG